MRQHLGPRHARAREIRTEKRAHGRARAVVDREPHFETIPHEAQQVLARSGIHSGRLRHELRNQPVGKGSPLPSTAIPFSEIVNPRSRSSAWLTPTFAPGGTTTFLSRMARRTTAPEIGRAH